MGASNENFPGVIRHSNILGGLMTDQARHNRKALNTIDSNTIRAAPYPCAVKKRGVLTENNAACNKKIVILVHRPITRKFAAQLAGEEHQLSLKEVKPSIQQLPSRDQSPDCIVIDAEDRNTNNHGVSIFVQHTESVLEEIDCMEAEVEMEELNDDEPMVDIDSRNKKNPFAVTEYMMIRNKKNPFAVTEYIDDMHAYYKKTESSSSVPPNYVPAICH